jgi:diguanylate cyclase (GGDEF)-like protein/PAS domain S-box-containing protein
MLRTVLVPLVGTTAPIKGPRTRLPPGRPKIGNEQDLAGCDSWPESSLASNPFRALVDSVRDYAIFLLDDDGIVQTWNTGAELITGYTADEIIGRHFAALYTPEETQRGWPQRSLALAAENGRFEDEGWRQRKNGQRFWADVIKTAMHTPEGKVCGYSEIMRDLTERKEQEEAMKRSVERSRQLWTQSIKDPLTGAFNRRYMIEQLSGAIQRSGWVTASIVVIDIDHFKSINDKNGHVAGDTALLGVAGLARRLSRDSDLVFRLGGDEFMLYLPGVAHAGAVTIAERLRRAVEQSDLIKGAALTLSIGVAELQNADTTETWLKRADAALYEAKRAGRNRVA